MTNDANDAKVQYYENEWRRAAAREYWLRAAPRRCITSGKRSAGSERCPTRR